MKRSAVALAALVMVIVFLPFQVKGQTPPLKIGYVDLRRVMDESEKGKEAKKNLGDEFEKKKKEITQKQDELQKMKDALEKQTATITPEARAEKEKQYQIKLKDYQRIADDYSAELRQKDQELTQRIVKELEDIVKGMGESEKYTLIFEKNHAGLLYATPAADVTEKVITLYNQSAKRRPAAAAPPAKKP
ncbi:MAG TPA: OmpH family outer membrane protein [Syntrophorhabdales bacterium]|nr:OmpH family outer membrane protein [Syntrophorhabdales bacterium]